MSFFSFKTYLYRTFWLEFEISDSELTPVSNFSFIGQKIRELEFWPRTIPKTSWWRHTYLLMKTPAKFLWLLRDFVPEYHHAKLGCNWATNKGKTEGGGTYMVPKDPSLNRVKYFTKQLIFNRYSTTARRIWSDIWHETELLFFQLEWNICFVSGV